MILLMRIAESEEGEVHIVGTFDNLTLATNHVKGLTHPRNGAQVWERYEKVGDEHYWYRDAGDYMVAVEVAHNPVAQPMKREDAFGFAGLEMPETWVWHTPAFEYGYVEDGE